MPIAVAEIRDRHVSCSMPFCSDAEEHSIGHCVRMYRGEAVFGAGVEQTRGCWNILLFESGLYTADAGFMASGMYVAPVLSLSDWHRSGHEFKGFLLSIPFDIWPCYDMYGLEDRFVSCTFNPYVALDCQDMKCMEDLMETLAGALEDGSTGGSAVEVMYLCRAVMAAVSRYYRSSADKSVPEGASLSDRFIDLVRKNCLRERKLEFYASQLDVSVKYLSHTVSKQTGRRASMWIADQVISEAKRRLAGTDAPIQTIAEELGFETFTEFCRYFRAHAGMPPGKYRKACCTKD